jgi:3-dehydroquinate synthase
LFHGEAVLLDITLSSLIARERNLLSEDETGRLFHLISALGIELDTTILDPSLLWGSLGERTYHRNGLQRVPLPNGIGGCVFVNDVNADEIKFAVKLLEDRMAVNYDII